MVTIQPSESHDNSLLPMDVEPRLGVAGIQSICRVYAATPRRGPTISCNGLICFNF